MLQAPIFQMPASVLDDLHLQSSGRMIGEAAALAGSGRAAVLGCGRCTEIPLRQLGARFKHVDLVDLDGAALQAVETHCRDWKEAQAAFTFYHADLTGLIPQVEPLAQNIVTESVEPLACLTRLGELLASATPNFWRPPDDEPYRLIVCSAVLTQLQATARTCVERLFRNRFPDATAALTAHEPWRASVWNFARRLEDAFVAHLESLAAPGAVIYLSDTVHACWLVQSGPGAFMTEGSWIALRTSRLADYLSPEQHIVAERRWQWLRPVREGPYWGRLYGVQAIIYHTP